MKSYEAIIVSDTKKSCRTENFKFSVNYLLGKYYD